MFLRVIRENNLSRFSSVVCAIDNWLGYGWDSASAREVNDLIFKVEGLLLDENTQKQALSGGDAEMVYLALCAMSLVDAERAVQEASLVSQSEDVDKRFAALTLVKQLALTSGYRFVGEAVSDPDLRIAVLAVNSMLLSWKPGFEKDDTFERLESVVDRFPKKAKELDPLVWPWVKLSACATMWGDALLSARG